MHKLTIDELIATDKMLHHHAKGYVEFWDLMNQLQVSGQPIYVFFCSSKDETGKRWNPDCVTAERVIKRKTAKMKKSHFVHVDIGDRAYWRNVKCPFRKDRDITLVFIPTLMKWNTPKYVDGERCYNLELLEGIFKE